VKQLDVKLVDNVTGREESRGAMGKLTSETIQIRRECLAENAIPVRDYEVQSREQYARSRR